MTREEAIKYLKKMKDECNDTFHKVRYVTREEALDMAIKALSADCISFPKGALKMRGEGYVVYNYDWLKENWQTELKVMGIEPSIQPKSKTGHWVHGEYCSECGCDVPAYISDWKWQKDMDAKYCPNCGAKMESEEIDADSN